MRLFVAIELGKEIKGALRAAQRTLREHDRMVRWAGEEQMHLTLKFLGEVPDSRVEEISSAVESAASASVAFELALCGAGCFPSRSRVRVLWVGIGDDGEALVRCQREVEDQFDLIGFPPERRPFSPHLTLGRVREDRSNGRLRDAANAIDVPQISQAVDSIVLMRSELLPQGARYTRVGTWPLGGG